MLLMRVHVGNQGTLLFSVYTRNVDAHDMMLRTDTSASNVGDFGSLGSSKKALLLNLPGTVLDKKTNGAVVFDKKTNGAVVFDDISMVTSALSFVEVRESTLTSIEAEPSSQSASGVGK